MEDLVRTFVRESNKNKSNKCQFIFNQVLNSTRYRLPIRTEIFDEFEKRNILIRILEDWQICEGISKLQMKEIEELTMCTISKTKLGFFKYTDSQSGKMIKPEEYAHRYRVYLLLKNTAMKNTNDVTAINDKRGCTEPDETENKVDNQKKKIRKDDLIP